jgi:hypothetical protein
MSSLGYVELLGLLDEVDRIGRTQTLKISLEALAGPPPAPTASTPPAGASEPAGAAPTMFDAIRTNDLLYEETQRLRNLLLARIAEMHRATRSVPASAPADAVPAVPRSWTGEEIIALLDGAQMAMIKHPTAAQAAFSALVREGRRFAETPEGGRWLDVLGASGLMRRARWIWETTSLNMLEEDAGTIVPSTYLEALLRATDVHDLEQILSRVTGMGHE